MDFAERRSKVCISFLAVISFCFKTLTSPRLTATPRAVWTVEMHNVFDIGPAVPREFLTVTLSVEGCTDLKNIVHFFRMRVTKFCTRGGWMAA